MALIIAIAFVLAILVHMYRTDHSMEDILEAHILPGGLAY
jgi:hypothetical protein